MASEKEWAKKTAKSLMLTAEGLDKHGGSDPESVHRIADQIRAQATALLEYASRLQ
jgi:hypothetical protein